METSNNRIGARGRATWCFTPRKPLFLRRRAPRPLARSAFGIGRHGASLPANPCSFVAGHHVRWLDRHSGSGGVVPRSPQPLVPPLPGTTFLGPVGPSAAPAWCFTPRKPLFLRRRAPRLSGRIGLRHHRRGASLPAKPCSFVAGHHALDFLQSDNSGNPPRVPGIPISPKKTKNVGAGAAPAAPRRHFPFSPINR